MKNHSYS
ncbi:hypothetical protein YPPY19_3530, partial [Yersinia pestis PY-19]